MIMELVDALTLDQQLPKNHGQAVEIFSQIARGLSHMHERGFVHADIKPNNVLVGENNRIKIIDLGQACAIGTVKKRIQGTPGYMAPEQAHRGEITPQTDIYNLGAMMYWVLVGEVIPTAMPPTSQQEGLLTGAVDTKDIEMPNAPHNRNPRIHPLLSKQIMDCIQPHKKDRPESMEYVANRLELTLDVINEPIAQTPPLDADGTTVCEE
jgi:serine/threonine-protein kinase